MLTILVINNINQYENGQKISNNDGSYQNGNQEVNQNSQVNNNMPPMQFNAMLLEFYISSQNIEV